MSNLPLKPLKWSENFARSAFHQYLVRKDPEAKKNSKSQYQVSYGRINTQQSFDVATGFATIDDAKTWCWNHYNEKMQPYVVPSPTWIDASKQLPSEDGKYLVCFGILKGVANCDVDNFDTESKKWDFFDSHDLPSVIAWVPIPEFKQGE